MKQTLYPSGMRWKTTGAKILLSLRAPNHTVCRWTQL
jgi:hypothetical protein